MIKRWPEAANRPAQRRRQCDLAVCHVEPWKQLTNLPQSDAPNVSISWIVEGKVVPQKSSARDENPVDFPRCPLPDFIIQHRSE